MVCIKGEGRDQGGGREEENAEGRIGGKKLGACGEDKRIGW